MSILSDVGSLKAYIRGSKRITTIASAALMFILLLSFFTLRPIYIIPEKSRTNASTGTSTASESSITLASTNTDTSVVLTPGAGFTLSSASSTSSYDVTTNNYTGYTITLTSEDNDKTLVHTVDNTKVISSINTPIAETDFVSTTSGLMNHFGIKPNKYYDTENNTTIDNTVSSTILPAPGTTGLILDKTSSANSTANNYSIALGAMVDGTIPAGDYTRDTILTVIPNPIYYTINYDKNTTDTAVSNIPARQSSSTSETTITLASTVPTRTHYSFIGWCNKQTTTSNGVDSCTGAGAVIYNPNGNGTNLTYGIDQTTENTTTLRAMWKIDTFTQRTYIRYENADGTWGSYSLADTKVVNYGSPYSWSIAATTSHQAASVSSYTVTEDHDNYVSIYRNTFTCYKKYRQQLANGSWDNYVNDTAAGTETVRYGGSCSYSKTITDYKNAENGTNNSTASTSANEITSNVTLKLDFYRNTFSLTVTAGANTSSATGSGTYRWGQTVAVGVTKATDVTCTSYATPTWTATAGTAPAAGASSSYTMPSSNATVTATSAASSVAQTITLSRTGGASGIVIDGTNQTGSSVGLYCGNHTISGSYTSGYEFSSWAVSGGVSVASTATASTTMNVTGAGTLTLNGKQSCVSSISGTMQAFNPSVLCSNVTSGTLTDSRGGSSKSYTVAKIGDVWWMATNLDLPGGTTLTSADSNVSAGCNLGGAGNCTLPASSTEGFRDSATAYVYNSNSTTCASGSPCYSYYSYAAATAGTNPSSGDATSDICPKGWRLPTQAELTTLKRTYTTGATLTTTPFNGVYAGSYSVGSFGDGGSRGYYWSSTAYDASLAYRLYFRSSSSNVGTTTKSLGVSIRCVLQ